MGCGIIDLGDVGKNLLCSVVLGSEFRGELGTVGCCATTESFRSVCTVIDLRLCLLRPFEVMILSPVGSAKFGFDIIIV